MKINIRINIIFFIIIFIFSTLLCGCYDAIQLHEISVVMGIGIDKVPGEENIRGNIRNP